MRGIKSVLPHTLLTKHPMAKCSGVQMVDFCRAARHLRSTKNGSQIAMDIIKAVFPSLGIGLQDLEQEFPCGTLMDRARSRLDITCMLVRRIQGYVCREARKLQNSATNDRIRADLASVIGAGT